VYREKGKVVSSSMHYMFGEQKDIDAFIKDLSKDKKVLNIERKGNMFFLLEESEEKVVQFFNPKIIFVKPVVQDIEGYETWEIASWERSVIERFVKSAKKVIADFKLLKFVDVKIDNIFFPRLMPNLTDKQKHAIELAISKGYYKSIRKTNLRALAKEMGISLSTFEQHLRAAEEKLIPNILTYSY